MSERQFDQRGDRIVRVEFSIPDDATVLGAAAAEAHRLTLADAALGGPGQGVLYFGVDGRNAGEVLDRLRASEREDLRVVGDGRDGGLVEVVPRGTPAVLSLAELGALPRAEDFDGETATVVADVPPRSDPRTVIGDFLDAHPGAELAVKSSESSFAAPDHHELRALIDGELTSKQREALELAYRRGYFDCHGERPGRTSPGSSTSRRRRSHSTSAPPSGRW